MGFHAMMVCAALAPSAVGVAPATRPSPREATQATDRAEPSTGKASVRGTVVLRDGSPAPAGLTVLATDPGANRWSQLVERVARGEPASPAATTAADGSFEIVGLAEDARYSLYAGGLGLATTDSVFITPATGTRPRLAVVPLYAVVVDLVDRATGGPLRVSRHALLFDRFVTWRCSDAAARRIEADWPSCILAGVDPAWLEPRDRYVRQVVVYSHPQQPERIELLELDAEFPGYLALLGAEYTVRPLSAGVHRVTTKFQPIDAERGELALRWLGSGEALRVPAARSVFALRVDLRSEPGAASVLFAVDDWSQPELVLEHVPHGEYVLSIANYACTRLGDTDREILHDRGIQIGAERLTLDVDVSAFGGLAIELVGAGGQLYEGRLRGMLKGIEPRCGGPFFFGGPPYTWLGLAPQRYELGLDPQGGFAPTREVELRPGELTRLRIELN